MAGGGAYGPQTSSGKVWQSHRTLTAATHEFSSPLLEPGGGTLATSVQSWSTPNDDNWVWASTPDVSQSVSMSWQAPIRLRWSRSRPHSVSVSE